MKTPAMISGDWQPTPNPAGRNVRFHQNGIELRGTVVAAELSEDWPAVLYVEVAQAHEDRSEYPVSVRDAEWIDDEGNNCTPWSESDSPTGRWVIFTDDDGVERSGCVVSAETPDFGLAVLSVVVIAPDHFKIHDVDSCHVKWLPE